MSVSSTGPLKQPSQQCCANCELFHPQSASHGRCDFWKCMDVMPMWMEGEKIPSHTVNPSAGSDCEAFVPKADGCSNERQTWLLNNLTSLN